MSFFDELASWDIAWNFGKLHHFRSRLSLCGHSCNSLSHLVPFLICTSNLNGRASSTHAAYCFFRFPVFSIFLCADYNLLNTSDDEFHSPHRCLRENSIFCFQSAFNAYQDSNSYWDGELNISTVWLYGWSLSIFTSRSDVMAILHEVQNSAGHKEYRATETSSSHKIASWNLCRVLLSSYLFPT